MSDEPLTPVEPPALVSVLPAALVERVFWALVVIFLPPLAFFGAAVMIPEWQNGQVSAYAALLLNPKASIIFLLLIAYSVISFLLLIKNQARFGPKLEVRFGVYTGVLLALQFIIIASVFFLPSLVAGPLMLLFIWAVKKISQKYGALAGLGFLIGAPVAVSILWTLIPVLINIILSRDSFSLGQLPFLTSINPISQLPILSLVALVSASPFLCFWLMQMTARRLFRVYELPLALDWVRATGIGTWLTVYTAAWAFSIYRMFQLYAALPKSPPDCYIATAAARGHPAVVGSHPVHMKNGTLMVNRQLQTLKLAELTLMALTPGFHRPLRRFYDIIGRPLAHRLTHPLLADLAYLLLKPAEFISRAILRILLPNFDEYIARLYC